MCAFQVAVAGHCRTGHRDLRELTATSCISYRGQSRCVPRILGRDGKKDGGASHRPDQRSAGVAPGTQ